jgi:hypothetical protein
MWVLFVVECLFKYGPAIWSSLMDIVKSIEDMVDDAGKPLSGEKKRALANVRISALMVQSKGVQPTKKTVATAREWAVQRMNGRGWRMKDHDMAASVGLARFYS